jgi:predicted transcriptional regulator
LEATQFSYHVAQDSLASELILYVEPPFDFRGSSLTNLYLELLKGAAIQSASLNETILITNRISFNFAIRSTSKRRNEYEIISQILTALTSGALAITELALYSKLNFRNAKLYMDLLVKKGLVFTIDENGRMKYMISDRGYAFLRNFQALKSLL